ncbi:hypothetical protein HYT17_03380 [Candidatus Microgenomates bacterium]|nr:hypothetical protein [Candidatus Microgenomates bacterium]
MPIVEKGPKPGTNKAIVFDALSSWAGENLPPPYIADIADKTGLSASQVAKAKRGLIETSSITSAAFAGRAEAIAHAKHSIWPVIKPYAVIGMTAAEIRLAVKLEKGEDLRGEKIETLLGHARREEKGRSHPLPKRTAEEKREARINALKRTGELQQRVEFWLMLKHVLTESLGEDEQLQYHNSLQEVGNILTESDLQQVPKTSLDWFLLVTFWHARKAMVAGNSEPFSNFAKILPEEKAAILRDCIVVIRNQTQKTSR